MLLLVSTRIVFKIIFTLKWYDGQMNIVVSSYFLVLLKSKQILTNILFKVVPTYIIFIIFKNIEVRYIFIYISFRVLFLKHSH